jgi:hypothetical protein
MKGNITRLAVTAASVALMSGALWPSAAQAAADTQSQAVCVAQLRNSLSPPISLTHSTTSYSSNGETGTIVCIGTVNGHQVTGPGTVGDRGTATGTCLSGSVSGVISMTIPTAGGPVAIQVPVDSKFVGGLGQRPGGVFPGFFAFVPTMGDCVLTPAREVGVVIVGTLLT